MDAIIQELQKMDDKEAREYISTMFDGYLNKKKEKRLYENSNSIPIQIILTYYTCVNKPDFDNINVNFKKRYLYNENKLENVHTPEENAGLRLVYDFILNKNAGENINLYTISDIHEILYSKVAHPEYGGKYRTEERYLPGTGIDLTSPDLIVHEMNQLRYEIDKLVKEGASLGKNVEPEKLIKYIDNCIELKL